MRVYIAAFSVILSY